MRLALMALILLTSPASPLPKASGAELIAFDRITLTGGGTLSIHAALEPAVTLRGDAQRHMRVQVREGTLFVECRQPCPNRVGGEVRVMMPRLASVTVTGGGAVGVQGRFPLAQELAVDIRGGGAVDTTWAPAVILRAAISGGGRVKATVLGRLVSRINGGGAIEYFGDPKIESEEDGGGAVRRGGPARLAPGLGAVRDSRDGRTYGTVTIQRQTWMTANLAYLPRVCPSEAAECGVWVYGYDGADVAAAASSQMYRDHGALYDWHTAKEACPPGWRLPSDADWQQLEVALGMPASLASTSVWRGAGLGQKIKAGGESAFNVTFGGWRTGFGKFNFAGEHANFWCVDAVDDLRAYERLVGAGRDDIGRHAGNKDAAFSIRCIRD